MSATLTAKPFGASGVRLLFSAARGSTLELRLPHDGAEWQPHGEPLVDDEGVVVMKSLDGGAQPRLASWRLRPADGSAAGEGVLLPSRAQQAAATAAKGASVVELDDAEMAYNVLQWFGTIVVDGRPQASTRLCESTVCLDASAAAALPLKDDAVAIELSPEVAAVVAGRVRRSVRTITVRALEALRALHPWLFCEGGGEGGGTAQRRPVTPNLIDGTLLVGHQGHALRCEAWAPLLGLGGVLNLAAERVDPRPARDALAALRGAAHADEHCLEVRAPSDGAPLTDGVGDGARLREVLPAACAAIAAAIAAAAPHGRVFVHCQQGRSRAGSVAVAHLLTTHPSWTLHDALRFLAARRPEAEIAHDYIEALEAWAVGELGRAPSLPRCRAELSQHLRPPPLGGGGGAAAAGAGREAPAG